MVKLSEVIDPIYREYAPILESAGLELGLDVKNPILEVKDPSTIEFELKKYLEWINSNGPRQGKVIIFDQDNKIIIRDSSTVLDSEQINLFISDTVSIKSRVGFGTTISIKL